MSYVALYRKYRPNTFEDIVGQENITKILRNQIKTGKISHAYIFSGSRGTGKTSAAKVFARAINCLNPHEGEPCNECEVCRNITEGNITDVIEMDAASNNSVENIRQIRQEVVYATIDVKYRVYIIDEVHMLTTSAFNALLKTLEEPPENVVFILATTEQHKIPVTILSRCLRFEFNRIPDEDIIKRLKFVLEEEKLEYEEDAIEYIAKLAEGGLRDALSILDRCISESQEILKYDDVLRIVGAIDKQIVQNIVCNICDLNSISAIENIDMVIQKGKDLRQLVNQITEEFLNILIINDKKNEVDQNRIIQIIDRLSKLDNDLRQTSKPTIVLKSCIIELCNVSQIQNSVNISNTNNVDNSALINKINILESEIEKLKDKLNNGISNYVPKPMSTVSTSKANEVVVEEEKINLKKFEDIDGFKRQVVEQGKLKLYSALAGSDIYVSQNLIAIITNNSFAYNILKTEESIECLATIFNEKYSMNKKVHIELSEKKEDNDKKIEKLFKEKDVNYIPMD